MSFAISWLFRYKKVHVFVLLPAVPRAWTCLCSALCPLHHKSWGM